MGRSGGDLSGRVEKAVRATRSPVIAATGATWLVGAATTVMVLAGPGPPLGFQNRSLQLVLDSINGSIALLAAFLLYGRYRRSRLAQDLLVAEGLFLLALGGVGFTVALDIFAAGRSGTLDLWLPQVARVTGAACLCVAALVGRRQTAIGPGSMTPFVPWVVIGTASLGLYVARDHLPQAARLLPVASASGSVTAHPLLLAGLSVGAIAFLLASALFTAQAAAHPEDELLRWLGPASGLLGFSRVHYLLFPSIYNGWIAPGDVFRSGAYVLLLVGAAREISRFWEAEAEVAVLADRRRVARELHDGVVQELAYIRLEARALTRGKVAVRGAPSSDASLAQGDPSGRDDAPAAADPPAADPSPAAEAIDPAPMAGSIGERILGACDRAIDEARAAIDALGHTSDEPVGELLQRAARQVAGRYAGRVVVDIDQTVVASPEQRHALARITREAVSNAMRHGGAERIDLELGRQGERMRLVVRDDGCGFDPAQAGAEGTGYGLTTMRERALALPGTFEIRAVPGQGTIVEVSWR